MTDPVSRLTIILPYVTPLRKAQSSTPISFTSHRSGTDIRWISRSTVSPLRGTPVADNNFRADSEEHFKPCWVTTISQRLVRRRYLNTSIPWLFSESLFPTIRIVTKELARLKRDDNRMAKNRKICNSPVITAMNATAHMAAIWTDPMRKITSCVYMIGAHIFELHLFNRQVTWRIKGR